MPSLRALMKASLGKKSHFVLNGRMVHHGFDHENHVGARGEEHFRADDRHGACGAVLIEKHGRGVVMVIAVEEYERLTVRLAAKGKAAETSAEAARK